MNISVRLARADVFGALHGVDMTVDGCWPWADRLSPSGYGVYSVHGIARRAHRRMFELVTGPIADGMQLDHLCRNRSCVNPAHLEPVTPKENTLRGAGRGGALYVSATHCPKGHAYAEHAYRYEKLIHGKRVAVKTCRVCHLARVSEGTARYQARKKAGLV